jgi:CRP-like cAMP-binding protein
MASPPQRLFAGLDPRTSAALLGRMTRHRFDAGQHLCRQGDAGDSLYLIMGGLLEIWLEQDGERRLIARLRPGDAVGEMSLLTGEPRAASVVARRRRPRSWSSTPGRSQGSSPSTRSSCATWR